MTERVEFEVDETTAAYLRGVKAEERRSQLARQPQCLIFQSAHWSRELDVTYVEPAKNVDDVEFTDSANQAASATTHTGLDARISGGAPQEMEQVSNALRAAQDL